MVISPDNRDSGKSGKSNANYHITDMADDMACLIRDLNIAPTNIIGVSMGSFIAQHLYLRHKEYVKKLILVSSTAGGKSHIYPDPEAAKVLYKTPDESQESYLRRLQIAVTGPGFADRSPSDIELLVSNALKFPISQDGYNRQFTAALTHYNEGTRDRLKEIMIPSLIIHGMEDPLIPFENGQMPAKEICNADFIPLKGVGHLPHIENTDQFNLNTIEFLRK